MRKKSAVKKEKKLPNKESEEEFLPLKEQVLIFNFVQILFVEVF